MIRSFNSKTCIKKIQASHQQFQFPNLKTFKIKRVGIYVGTTKIVKTERRRILNNTAGTGITFT